MSPTTRGTFGGNAQGKRYGFFSFADYFTNRQLVALTTFSDLVIEARERVLRDARTAGAPRGDRLESGGTDAEAYALLEAFGFPFARDEAANAALRQTIADEDAAAAAAANGGVVAAQEEEPQAAAP